MTSGLTDVARFTDAVLDQIEATLASRAPERGGALIEAGGVVHHLVEDVDGVYTSSSWDISPGLTDRVQSAERHGRGRLAGTVHSHPAGVPDPSSQDMRATARTLDENPHIDSLLVGVLSEGTPRPADLAVGQRWRMSVHVARRAPHGACRLSRAVPAVMPIAAHRRGPAVDAGAGVALPWMGAQHLALPVGGAGAGPPTLLVMPAGYPGTGPRAVHLGEDGSVTPAGRATWDPDLPPDPQLRALLAGATGQPLAGSLDRVEGLAGCLTGKRVVVAGLGSVGSWVLMELARAGVTGFDLLDPEAVEAPNLSRTAYEARHVGMAKVLAGHDLVRAVNPGCEVTGRRTSIAEATATLATLCGAADLVVAATDDPTGQAILAHHAYAAGTPLVACALYRRAEAGEVVVVIPELGTPCWHCAIGGIASTARPERDYGTGRLVAEPGLGPAVHLVSEVAAGIAVALLAGPETPAGEPVAELLASGRTLGMVTTRPRWDLFAEVFAEQAGHQWAPQSLWARPCRDPACPVCGPDRAEPGVPIGLAFARIRDRERKRLRPGEPDRSPTGRVVSAGVHRRHATGRAATPEPPGSVLERTVLPPAPKPAQPRRRRRNAERPA